MEKLEILLQEMVVRRFGKKMWYSVVRRSVALGDFDQHVESYGVQRVVSTRNLPPGPDARKASPAGSPLFVSAAEILGVTVARLLEELGVSFARSLQAGAFPRAPLASGADYFSAAAFYYNSCSWILEEVVPDSLLVTASRDGWLKVQCGLRDSSLCDFLRGFLSKILGGADGPSSVSHAETVTLRGETVHSFVMRGSSAPSPATSEACLAVA